jgi:hypothetical protein
MGRLARGVLLISALSLSGCGLVAESYFEIAPNSRLPRWFVLPRGVARADVTVTLTYYADNSVVFRCMDVKGKPRSPHGTPRSGWPIAHVRLIRERLEPIYLGEKRGYPMYEIFTVRGVTEVIEHRKMEPLFYITDDPAVLERLGIKR